MFLGGNFLRGWYIIRMQRVFSEIKHRGKRNKLMRRRIRHLQWFILVLPVLLFGLDSPGQPSVDHISLITTPIFLRSGPEPVMQGTGFFFALKRDEKTFVFLVTNFHVLTGAPPSENKPPIGDNIVFYCHRDRSNPADVKRIAYPLFTTDGNPVWITSGQFPDADIAAIPLASAVTSGCQISGISKDWTSGKIKLRPTSVITLVGYPHGYYDKVNSLPVWKTGAIASEPSVNFGGKPLFLVDISAFPGMSGSPAFAIAYGSYEGEEGGTIIGNIRKFLGIYASMQMVEQRRFLEEFQTDRKLGIIEQLRLELGHIWKAELVNDLIESIDVEDYELNILRKLR